MSNESPLFIQAPMRISVVVVKPHNSVFGAHVVLALVVVPLVDLQAVDA